MTVSKNFVVKNGLEVNTDLILADITKSSVGIATTNPDYTLHVNGGIGATDLNVTGIATAVQIDATTLNVDTGNIVTGVVTTISGTDLTYTNINGTTIDGSNINADNLYAVSGIVTNITGTASTFTSSEISTLNAASANLVSGVATNFTVSGVTTLGVTTATSLEIGPINTISVNSGIITATSGVVTYYGDGQYLTNIQSGVGIRTEGAIIGYGATFLDFRGAGVSTITAPVSGIATINITGGGGGGSISVSTEAPSGPASGDLWYSPDRARTFIYYDESVVGYGTGAQWIDASPFNVGVLTQTSLTVPELTITGNVITTGIITATTFSGNLTGNVTGNVTGNLTGDVTGNADTATALETPRNINETAFDGTANITVEPYVEDDESSTTSKYLTFVDSSTAAFQRLNEDSGLSYIPSLGALTVGSVRSYESLVGTASSTRIDYTVTVATKTANHRYIGQGSANAFVLDDIESPFITLLPGKTYRFDQADSTNSGHPLRFYLEADKTTAYTTNVTTNGSPGSSGAYTEILITDSTPQVLHYQCSSHAYMGNSLSANSNIAGGLSVADESSDTSCNVLFTTDATGPALSAKSGTNLTFNSSSGALTATSFVGNLTGNVTGNLTGDVTGDVTGNADTATTATNVTVADESSDTSCNVLFVTAATGNLPPKSGTNLTFNSSSGTLTATSFSGDGSSVTNVNATTLDSIDSTSFLRSDAADTKTSGDLTFNDNIKANFGTGSDLQIYHDGSNSYIVDSGTGNLIMKAAGSFLLQGAGNNENIIVANQDGSVELWYDNSKKLETTTTGVTVTGDVNSTSDINLKKDIEVVTSATEILNQLRGVKFTWKENDEKSVGVIAQEVEAILPELVRGEEGNKSVNYSGLVGVLIEAVKELSARVEELENK